MGQGSHLDIGEQRFEPRSPIAQLSALMHWALDYPGISFAPSFSPIPRPAKYFQRDVVAPDTCP